MADTKRAVGGGSRFLVRGCPRCRGTLERLDEREVGRLVTSRWHCINCGRSHSEDALSPTSPLPRPAGTGTWAGPCDTFSSKPALLAPRKAMTR